MQRPIALCALFALTFAGQSVAQRACGDVAAKNVFGDELSAEEALQVPHLQWYPA